MSQTELIQKLRQMTGAGMMDCKKALQESSGDLDKAVDYLREKGKAKAAKKASRGAGEGIIYSYIHAGDKLGVLVELNCETDFVARTDEFRTLAKEIAMQVAAADPKCVRREDVSGDVLEREKEIIRKQLLEEGKPEKIIDKIVDGKLNKFYQENCLLEQAYIRDDKKNVKEVIEEGVAKLGENIQVSRFCRLQVGVGV
jgi:elongation factor Ts